MVGITTYHGGTIIRGRDAVLFSEGHEIILALPPVLNLNHKCFHCVGVWTLTELPWIAERNIFSGARFTRHMPPH